MASVTEILLDALDHIAAHDGDEDTRRFAGGVANMARKRLAVQKEREQEILDDMRARGVKVLREENE